MVEFAGTRGFQDAWRNQRPCAVDSASELATFKPPRSTMQGQRISAAEKAKLSRVVRKAPEVMVRVGRASSKTKAGAVRHHVWRRGDPVRQPADLRYPPR